MNAVYAQKKVPINRQARHDNDGPRAGWVGKELAELLNEVALKLGKPAELFVRAKGEIRRYASIRRAIG